MTTLKLALYEFKKVGSSRLLAGLSVLLLLIGLFLCNRTIQTTPEQECLDNLVSIYQKNPEEILDYQQTVKSYARTAETDIPRVYSGSSAYNDYTLFEDFDRLLQAKEIYRQALEPVIRSLTYQREEFTGLSGEDSYAARRTARMIQLYEKEYEETAFPVERAHGWDKLFSFDTINILILSVTVLGASLFFTSDSKGQLAYIGVTYFGRRTRMMSKLLASCLYAIAVPTAFVMAIAALIGIRSGFSAWNMPLATFEMFQYEPYGLTVGQFFWFFLMSKWIGALCATALTGIISLFVKRPAAVLFLGMIPPGVSCLLYLTGGQDVWHRLNIYGWMHLSPLVERYHSQNGFGHPWDLPSFACTVAIVFFVILAVSYGIFSERCWAHSPAENIAKALYSFAQRLPARFKSKKRAPAGSRTLFSGELFKTVIASRLLPAILILLTVAIYGSALSYTRTKSIEETMVKDYISSLHQLDEDQIADRIRSERLRIDSALDNEQTMNLKYRSGEISSREYSAYLEELNYARKHDIAFGKVEAQWSYVLSRRAAGYRAELVYDTDWMHYFNSGTNLPGVVIPILLGVCLFSQEYGSDHHRNGWIYILRSTPAGRRRLFRTKLLAALFIGLVAFLLTTGADLFFAFRKLDLSVFSAHLASIRQFSNVRLDVSLGWFCALRYAVRLFGFLTVSVLSCLTGSWLKHPVYAAFLTGTILLVPALADQAGLLVSRYAELILILNGTTWFIWLGAIAGDNLPVLMAVLLLGWIVLVAALSFVSSHLYAATRSPNITTRRKANGTSAVERY
ncbi:MAG: hypothetical protein IKS35_01795 [Clostridia bacterium]|nr:hypothetical protein [Clostridia bacterium]